MKKIIALFATILISLGVLRAQTVAVSGTVVDELNRPMVGVSVVETDNVANGTVTDPQGRFSMKVKNVRSTIQTSYIGYITRILEVTAKPMTIAMEPSATNVEEVVVVGYGVQKKQSVVGAISSATSEDLKQMGSPNLSTALAGKVAGVTFTVPSGRPGSDDAEIYVRGVATMSGDSAPLVLVDGVERDYSQVDPEDVAQLSVLKDASATAVYGVRGANGVILITTKRGSKGAPKFNMNYTFTLQQPTRLPTFLGSYDHASAAQRIARQRRRSPGVHRRGYRTLPAGRFALHPPRQRLRKGFPAQNDADAQTQRQCARRHGQRALLRGAERTLAGRHLPAVRRQIPFERQFQTHQPPCEPRLFADEDHRTESRPQRTSRPEAEQQSGSERQFDLLDDVRNAPDVLPLPASRRFLRRQHG
ncbi:MAG: TonB-dependent receptor plug domain-containing protein [Alistipes finegoldii]